MLLCLSLLLAFFAGSALQRIHQCSFDFAATSVANSTGQDKMLASLLSAAAAASSPRQGVQGQDPEPEPNCSGSGSGSASGGRKRMQQNHDDNIAAMAIANAQKAAERASTKFKHVINMASSTQQHNISKTAFGYGNQCKDTYKRFGQESTALGDDISTVVNKTGQVQAGICKGLASHLTAVRQKLCSFLENSQYIVHSDVSDEASMWCRRSLTSRELEHLNTACAKKKAKAMASGGKGKHSHCERMVTKKTRVPCLNQVQHIRLELESSQKTIAFQLHSPTQAMGKGNWSTMLRAKRKWSFQCCGVVGSQLEDRRGSNGSNKLQKAADAVRYIGKCVTQDAAAVNTCVLAREQAAMQEKRAPGRIRTMTTNKCQSHQACLLNRSVYDEDDHAAFLARLSHLLQNNRTCTSVLEKADLYLASIFDYVVVDETSIPAEMPCWQEHSRSILKRCSRLSDEEVSGFLLVCFRPLRT